MYQPIKFSEFEMSMRQIGARVIDIPGTEETVFELKIITKSGKSFPETIRVYSTVPKSERNGYSRRVGTDAIRIVVVRDDRVVISAKRVNRTGSPDVVLNRVVDRIRSAFKYVINPENRGPSGYLFSKGRNIQ